MEFQSLLPYIAGIVASALSLLAGKFLPKLLDNKYYILVAKLYPLLDPVLAENIKPYGESGVRKIIQEVVLSISDNQLSTAEVTKVIDLFLKEFNLAKAASTPVTSDALLVMEAVQTATSVSEIDLSGIKFSFR